MEIHLISKKENLIKVDDEQFYLNCQKQEISKNETFFLKIYPIFYKADRVLIPFCAKIEIIENKLFSNCENLRIINYPTFSEIEILSLELYRANSQNLINEFAFSHNGQKFEIKVFSNCENNFVIKSNVIVFKHTLKNISECSIYKVGAFIVVSYNQTHLLIFNIEKNSIELECEIEQFEINNATNQISIVKKLKDSLNHGTVMVVNLSKGFEVVDNYLTYLSEEKTDFNDFAEFVFFDCIKANNFECARKFLTQDLNNAISNETLEAYFNEYCEIKQSNDENKFYLIPNGKNALAKIFVFEKKENKINNIKSLYI